MCFKGRALTYHPHLRKVSIVFLSGKSVKLETGEKYDFVVIDE